jgi:hypothetical protein
VAEVERAHAAHHAVGGFHGHRPDATFAQVLLHFSNDVQRGFYVKPFTGDAHGVVDFGQMMFGKFNVQNGADDLHDAADLSFFCSHVPAPWGALS